ncbi:MAG: aminopeptidase [Oscillospiraceae bacterium]|nr:aminopeptidase [Oscillospiraceae bacterium]
MSEIEDYKKKLFFEPKNGYDCLEGGERLALESYCEDYKAFLTASKTECLAVRECVRLAEERGFVPCSAGMELKAGDKVYRVNRGKAIYLAVIGKKPLAEGCGIAGAHVDSPRLDLKPRPLYEDGEMALLKTHYYGGIKKYQWVTIPLELHGVVALKSSETVDVSIGAEPDDPKLVITDLLPHLSADQYKKSVRDFIPAENLNIVAGSVPYAGEGGDRVKLAVMSLLNDRYGITEEDFLSAELEAVPSYDAVDIGLDRSFIGGYGHDDRVCAYAELRAMLDIENPERTAVCILADKEEIGSEGTSGMQSLAFERFIDELCDTQGAKRRDCFANSLCISADVCNAFDPTWPEVSEKRNSAMVNYGVTLCKYTGHGGKSGTNDADAETVAALRRIFDGAGVVWQTAELGKVDQGGGGTIAMYMSRRDIATIDAGVPVLSMHAPFEVVGKLDCYMTYKGIRAMYENY